MGKRPLVVAFLILLICVVINECLWENKSVDEYDSLFDGDKIDVDIEGSIYKITNGNNGDILWVKDKSYGKIIMYPPVTYDSDTIYHVGNTIAAKSVLYKLENATNEGGFDAYEFYTKTYNIRFTAYASSITVTDGSVDYIKDSLYGIKNRLCDSVEAVYDDKDSGIIKAMLFADKTSVDAETKKLYSQNGIAHILAISGLHISILGTIFYSCIMKMTSSLKISTILSIIVIMFYGLMTGFSVSTNRAVVMMIIMMIGRAIGRTYDMSSALALSGIIILMQNPRQIFSTGFQLSYLSVLAVCIVFPTICYIVDFNIDDGEYMKANRMRGHWLARRNIYPFVIYCIRKAQAGFWVSFSITLITLPVILSNYYEIQILSIILNIIVVPLMTIVVGMAFVSSVIGMYSVTVARLCAGAVHYILGFYNFLCRIPEKTQIPSWLTGKPKLSCIIMYYIIIAAFLSIMAYIQYRKRIVGCCKIIIICVILIGISFFRPAHDEKLHVDMLDVGQGDGICVQMPDGKVLLVDGGSSSKENVGENVISKYLKYHGIEKVDIVCISHMDEDHVNGVVWMLNEGICEGGTILISDIQGREDEFDKIISLAKEWNVDVKYMSQGCTLKLGEGRLDFVYPLKNMTFDDRNEYSMAFILRYKEFSMLFTGDLGQEQECGIVDYANDSDIDLQVNIYKCAHHGSKYSSSGELLEKTKAQNALISVGKNNRYGHPSKEAVTRMEEAGMNCYATMDYGQLAIESDGSNYSIFSIKKMETLYKNEQD